MPITADDALAPMPSWGTMLKRGLTKRCARCGSGHLFDTWWRMKARCPRCGMRFEREEGYFTGVLMVNLAVAEGALLVVMVGFIFALGQDSDVSVWWPIAIGGVLAIVLPILNYPLARTIWFALDLIMRPLEMAELVEAAEAVATETGDKGDGAREDGSPGQGNDRSEGGPRP